MTATCWADPLSRKERRELSTRLARACGRFYQHRTDGMTAVDGMWASHDALTIRSRIMASVEMSDLHLDVTERAEVATS